MSTILDICAAPAGITAWWLDGKELISLPVLYFGRVSVDGESRWVPCVYDNGASELSDPTEDGNWLGVMFAEEHGSGPGQARQLFADRIAEMTKK